MPELLQGTLEGSMAISCINTSSVLLYISWASRKSWLNMNSTKNRLIERFLSYLPLLLWRMAITSRTAML